MSVIRTSGKRGPLRGVGPQLVHDPYPYTSATRWFCIIAPDFFGPRFGLRTTDGGLGVCGWKQCAGCTICGACTNRTLQSRLLSERAGGSQKQTAPQRSITVFMMIPVYDDTSRIRRLLSEECHVEVERLWRS